MCVFSVCWRRAPLPVRMAELPRRSQSVLMLGLEARSASHYPKTLDGRL